jgi:hypothetical protein
MIAWWRLFGPTYVPVGANGDVVMSVAGFPLGFAAYLTADEIGAISRDAAPSAAPASPRSLSREYAASR